MSIADLARVVECPRNRANRASEFPSAGRIGQAWRKWCAQCGRAPPGRTALRLLSHPGPHPCAFPTRRPGKGLAETLLPLFYMPDNPKRHMFREETESRLYEILLIGCAVFAFIGMGVMFVGTYL